METFPTASELAKQYGHRAKKRFGQHFLTDPNILRQICALVDVGETSNVLEIGPGCGALTTTLLDLGATVTAVEIDRDVVEFLTSALQSDRLRLVAGDAKELDLFEHVLSPRTVVANLPYNVASAILFQLLDRVDEWEKMALMFQKEVAQRITATPRTKAYGSMSVVTQLTCDVRLAMKIKPGAFSPPPKVDSAVVTFSPRPDHSPVTSSAPFQSFVRAAFSQRRKKMVNGLASAGFEKPVWEALLLEHVGSSTPRAEELTPEQFLDVFVASQSEEQPQ